MATRKTEGFIEVLMEHEAIPEGRETFGKLISQAMKETDAAREMSARQKTHLALYARWSRMAARHVSKRFPVGHPIYSDIKVWELHVCRFGDDAVIWFGQLDDAARIDLCELSRRLRQNLGR